MEKHAGLEHAQPERVQRIHRALDGTAHPHPTGEGRNVGRSGQGDVRPPAEQVNQLFVGATSQPLGERRCRTALRRIGALFGHPGLAAARQVRTIGRSRVHVAQLVEFQRELHVLAER